MASFAKTHSWELFLIRKAFSYPMKADKDKRALIRAFIVADPNSKEFYSLYRLLNDELNDWEPETQGNRIFDTFSIFVCYMHVARLAYDVLHPDGGGYPSFSEPTAIINTMTIQEYYSPSWIYHTRPTRELDLINPGMYKELQTQYETEAVQKIEKAWTNYVRNRAARVIQRHWEVCGYNPVYSMCKSRVLKKARYLC